MGMMMQITIPVEAGNQAARTGAFGRSFQKIIVKPEAAYFTEYDGRRGAVMIVDLADPSKIPALAEPWFLSFNADVSFHVVMSPEDLGRSGLEALAKKWG